VAVAERSLAVLDNLVVQVAVVVTEETQVQVLVLQVKATPAVTV
jgi:hypothetical protein